MPQRLIDAGGRETAQIKIPKGKRLSKKWKNIEKMQGNPSCMLTVKTSSFMSSFL